MDSRSRCAPRTERDRGAHAGRSAPAAAAASAAAAPRARARPGHNTPLLVLYGSNLGTAEDLATRVADLAEVNGFATRLAPLDDFVGQLPEQGGVLIFCASYNGAAPDNATQFVKWLSGDLPKDAFSKVRYAVFGCGNSDWAATYQSIPRLIDQQLAAHGARSVYARGEGDARSDLDGQFESWFAKAAPSATREFGLDSGITRSADDEPLYKIEPIAPSAVNTVVALGGVAPMKLLVNTELQNRRAPTRPSRSTRHIEVQLPAGVVLSRRRSPQRGSAQRSGAGRCGGAPLRLSARRSDPPAGRGRTARAIAGRRRGVGRAPAQRIRRTAAGRDPQADPDHVRAHKMSGDQAETAGLCRRRCRRHRTLPHGSSGPAQIGVRSARRASGLRTAVPCLSRDAVAAGAPLLFDLVVAVGRSVALQRHRRRGRRSGELGARHLQGHLLELPCRPPRRRNHPCDGARDQGGLPAAR